MPKVSRLQEPCCDKCGHPVPWENDATIIESYFQNEPVFILVHHSRHFLPTDECEGSPSRAQYIEGQPRDTRGYPYDTKHESKWRSAYAQAQVRESN
ncbi:MAG: hypothetical protein ACXACT_16430 [Candidatus Thorarchaeota archaeon]|jgi:hypothetical protein